MDDSAPKACEHLLHGKEEVCFQMYEPYLGLSIFYIIFSFSSSGVLS